MRLGRKLLVLFLVHSLAVSVSVSDAADVSQETLTTLGRFIVPSYRANNAYTLVKVGSPLLKKLNDEQLKAVNQRLEQEQLPSLVHMLGEARLELAIQGVTAGVPASNSSEIKLLLPVWAEELKDVIDPSNVPENLRREAELPFEISELEKELWDLHVYSNRLIGMQNAAEYAYKMFDKSRSPNQENSFKPIVDGLLTQFHELQQRNYDIRSRRVVTAVEVLSDEQAKFPHRLEAANAIKEDSTVLNKVFEAVDTKKLDNPILVLESREELSEIMEKSLAMHAHVIQKGQLLFGGIHWWIRGRYGMGTSFNGLIKNFAASKNPAARFPLYMPHTTPIASDPFLQLEGKYQTPYVQRRHAVVWAWENESRLADNRVPIIVKSDYFY